MIFWKVMNQNSFPSMRDAFGSVNSIFQSEKLKERHPGKLQHIWSSTKLANHANKSSSFCNHSNPKLKICASESTQGEKNSDIILKTPFHSWVPPTYPKVLRAWNMDHCAGPNFLFCQNHQRNAFCNFRKIKSPEKKRYSKCHIFKLILHVFFG